MKSLRTLGRELKLSWPAKAKRETISELIILQLKNPTNPKLSSRKDSIVTKIASTKTWNKKPRQVRKRNVDAERRDIARDGNESRGRKGSNCAWDY